VQLTLAAAVVALLLGSGVFGWWRNEQAQAGRERDARNAGRTAVEACAPTSTSWRGAATRLGDG
jgi:hypothetical protein